MKILLGSMGRFSYPYIWPHETYMSTLFASLTLDLVNWRLTDRVVCVLYSYSCEWREKGSNIVFGGAGGGCLT